MGVLDQHLCELAEETPVILDGSGDYHDAKNELPRSDPSPRGYTIGAVQQAGQDRDRERRRCLPFSHERIRSWVGPMPGSALHASTGYPLWDRRRSPRRSGSSKLRAAAFVAWSNRLERTTGPRGSVLLILASTYPADRQLLHARAPGGVLRGRVPLQLLLGLPPWHSEPPHQGVSEN